MTPATLRLSLREFEPRDRDALIAMHRDPRVTAMLVDNVPLHDARIAHRFIERIRAYYLDHPGLGIWCAERWASVLSAEDLADPQVRESLSDESLVEMGKPRPSFVGWFNLMRITDWAGEIEIGCRLLPQAWGNGTVHDGGERLLDKAFCELGLTRVWGICHPQHRSVRHVLKTLGFEDDGLRPCAGVPAHWFVIGADRWFAFRERPRRERMRAALRGGGTA
jgi:RimJ/RimL family protein N-acetyltransferase